MWAQYADGHRGVCLAFDRTKLIASFKAALADRGECLAEDVRYTDDVVDLSYDGDRLHEVGWETYSREYRRKHTHCVVHELVGGDLVAPQSRRFVK